MSRVMNTFIAAVIVMTGAWPGAWAATDSHVARPFEPPAVSPSVYAVDPPWENPGLQRHVVSARDGTPLYVETWLPRAKGGSVPPPSIPTVLVMTPYASEGLVTYTYRKAIRWLVPRGYAFSVMHVRGSGSSGGCIRQDGLLEADDQSRVIEYLGRDAPWTTGRVGSFGYSNPGRTQLQTAGLGDPARTRYLKAMVVGSPPVSAYESNHFDGVPVMLGEPASQAMYTDYSLFPFGGPFNLATGTAPQDFVAARTSRGGNVPPGRIPGRLGCQPDNWSAAMDPSGDVTEHWQRQDSRPGLDRISAPVLMFHGHADTNVFELVQAATFDRLRGPKAGLFGVFEHELPDEHFSGLRREWERPDFGHMVVAWYDRHLKEIDNGVEEWPVAQIQGSDGRWRAEPDWPATGGPVGHLALGAGGRLGVATPSGRSTYSESVPFDKASPVQAPNGAVWFETTVPDRLEITGQPMLDLWVVLDKPDAHLAAEIETFDEDGKAIPGGSVVGFRSMRHLDPLIGNRFTQAEGRPAPVAVPIKMTVRFNPTDLVVPAGGRIRLTIGGARRMTYGLESMSGLPVSVVEDPSEPSYRFTTVNVLHDCEHLSALRFLLARPDPDLLNVREASDPPGPLVGQTVEGSVGSDAGGLATAPVCGQAPIRLENFGPEIPYGPPVADF